MKLGEPYKDQGKWWRDVLFPENSHKPEGTQSKCLGTSWGNSVSPSWNSLLDYRVPCDPPANPQIQLPSDHYVVGWHWPSDNNTLFSPEFFDSMQEAQQHLEEKGLKLHGENYLFKLVPVRKICMTSQIGRAHV